MFTLPFPYLFESVGREKNIADREQKQLIGKLIRFATPHSLLRSKNFKKNCPKSFFVYDNNPSNFCEKSVGQN